VTAKQATLVAIAADPPEQRANLVAKLGLGFPVLSDPEREVIKRYGVEDAENEIAWPALFVIGPDGTILKRVMLETYKERPIVSQILDSIPGAASATGSASAAPSASAR